MRVVLINHCHPETPHVCAIRMREFANAMTRRGHKIVLFTETIEGQTILEPLEKLSTRFQQHSFDIPLHIATSPSGFPLLKLLRQGRLPWGIRQIVISWYFLRHQGVFADWRYSSRPYLRVLADEFKPDIIWSSFGGSDCWNIARDLSRMAGCPWVADLKDNWEVSIPRLLKRWLARHYKNATALTAFSEFHLSKSEPFFPMEKHVLYSGLNTSLMASARIQDTGCFQISLIGSIYNKTYLKTVLRTISKWSNEPNSTVKKIKFIYVGTAEMEIRAILSTLKLCFDIEFRPYLNQKDYYSLLKSSHLNLYIRNESTFHHKVFELIAARRPVICYPAETQEVTREAKARLSPFFSCNSSDEILEALQTAAMKPDLSEEANFRQTDWADRAVTLERLLLEHVNPPVR